MVRSGRIPAENLYTQKPPPRTGAGNSRSTRYHPDWPRAGTASRLPGNGGRPSRSSRAAQKWLPEGPRRELTPSSLAVGRRLRLTLSSHLSLILRPAPGTCGGGQTYFCHCTTNTGFVKPVPRVFRNATIKVPNRLSGKNQRRSVGSRREKAAGAPRPRAHRAYRAPPHTA